MSAIFSAVAVLIYGLQSVFENHVALFTILSFCLAGSLFRKNNRAIVLCICLMLVHGLADQTKLGQLWPAPVVLSSVFGLMLFSFLEKKFWLTRPLFGSKWTCVAISAGLVSAAAIVGWVHWASITADQIMFKIDGHLTAAKVAAVLFVFSILNSFSEEFLFRGPLLDNGTKAPHFLIFAQAFAFGLYHFKGFPFGLSGSLLAFAFAMMQGYLRVKSGNFYYIWISHFVANLGMGWILLRL